MEAAHLQDNSTVTQFASTMAVYNQYLKQFKELRQDGRFKAVVAVPYEDMVLAHRTRSDFCDLRLRWPSRAPKIAAISETRNSNDALRFKGAMESR